jgi:glyoxylase-like metal-dependent hydrolase (beta-lactamase superfamily II)
MSTVQAIQVDITLIRAPNPGPMTLTGTNTYVLGDPAEEIVVVDPGPLDEGHLAAIVAACGPIGASAIVLTHWHHDHSEAAAELAGRFGCPVLAADVRYRIGERGLADGDVIGAASCLIDVIATPGHTADSVCLLVRNPDGAYLLTGDTVLGTGTSVIMHPDGHLRSYLDSLQRLTSLVEEQRVGMVLPGHGPVVDDPAGWLAFYRRHREERLDQVRAALAAGDTTPAEIVARVYADVDRAVWPAATTSVAAQMEFLAGS